MKQVILICTITLFVCAMQTAAEEKPKSDVQEIPLKDAWAYRMPGTQNMQNLEPNAYGQSVRQLAMDEQAKRVKESLIFQIPNYLGAGGSEKPKPARPGFAVLGKEAQALREVHAVLVEDKKAKQSFPAN